MLKPLVRHQSHEDFLCLSPEMQICMYEALLGGYSDRFLPDWALLLKSAVLREPFADKWLDVLYPGLKGFAWLYRNQRHNGDHLGSEQLRWLEEYEYEMGGRHESDLINHEQAA